MSLTLGGREAYQEEGGTIIEVGQSSSHDMPAALKRDVLPGPAWNLVVDRLIPALDAMEQMPGVSQVGLRGDHLHAITLADQHTATSLQSSVEALGFSAQVEPTDPTLEDAFIALAGRKAHKETGGTK